jgi:hypothetical protein
MKSRMESQMSSQMSSPTVIGVDIGKEVFHLVGFAADGKIAFRRRIRRLGVVRITGGSEARPPVGSRDG